MLLIHGYVLVGVGPAKQRFETKLWGLWPPGTAPEMGAEYNTEGGLPFLGETNNFFSNYMQKKKKMTTK